MVFRGKGFSGRELSVGGNEVTPALEGGQLGGGGPVGAVAKKRWWEGSSAGRIGTGANAVA